MAALFKDIAFLRSLTLAALYCVGLWSVSHSLYPIFSAVEPITRYAATAVGGTGMVILMLMAFRAPKLLDFHVLQGLAIIGLIGGGICAFIGVQEQGAALVVIGACSMALARNVTEVLVVMTFSRLKKSQIFPCVTLAFLASLLLQLLLMVLPLWCDQVSYVVFPLISLLMMSKSLVPLFGKMQKSVAPSEVAATQPKAFLPFSHQLFVLIFLSRFAYGYALGLDEGAGGVPQFITVASLIPPMIVLAYMALAKPNRFNMDTIFITTIFLMMAGFALIPYHGIAFKGFVNTLLSVGSNCFLLILWCVFALIGHKSKQEGFIVLSWGRALLSIGVTVGAFLARSYNDLVVLNETVASFMNAIVMLLFLGYALFSLRNFSLVKIVHGIAPIRLPATEETPQKPVEDSCTALGKQYALTPREIEVLVLVAKGRSAPFIEEQLVISRNTVKSHVRHIYRKLDIHTNQELIDLVERTEAE